MLAVNNTFNNTYNKKLLEYFTGNVFGAGAYLVTGGVLDFIDSISDDNYNGAFTSSLGTYQEVVTGVMSGVITAEDLITDGLLSSATDFQVRKLEAFNSSNYSSTYDNNTSVLTMYHSSPLSVSPRFERKAEDGTLDSDLYIVIYRDAVKSFYKPVDETTRELVTYVAFSVTEKDGGGDIEFDHTEKIDYIDEVTLKVAFPNQIA